MVLLNCVRWFLSIAAVNLIAMPLARADSVESFYQGKSLNLIISYPPGGASDLYARLSARHLGNHIPGKPTIVPRNQPGAGGVIAANHLFNVAPKDGTTLGLFVPGLPLDEKLDGEKSKFRSAQFNWIGRLTSAPNVTFLMNTSQVKTIRDAFDRVAVLSATGRSATNAVYPIVLNNVLGTKFKVVTGYAGSAAAILAMERGEVEGHSSTYDTLKTVHPDWIAEKRVNVVVQYSLRRHAELPDVPTSVELAHTPEQVKILRAVSSASDIGKFLVTTPGVPLDRVQALRRAFDAMVRDPDFIADAKRLRVDIEPMRGEELQRLVEEIDNLPPDLLASIRTVYSPK
jgi:tripartite-type tricarboxylate transporter receptor subunit TctC